MRPYSALHPTFTVPAPPDTTQTILLTGGSSAQAMDWPSTAFAGGIVRISLCSTAGALMQGFCSLNSTRAQVPSSGTSTEGSTMSIPVQGNRTMQIPGASTCWSIASYTSGIAIVEAWGK